MNKLKERPNSTANLAHYLNPVTYSYYCMYV